MTFALSERPIVSLPKTRPTPCECSNVAEVGPYCPQCADAL